MTQDIITSSLHCRTKGVDGWITLGTNAETAALFNPMNGECGEAKVRQVDGKDTSLSAIKIGRIYHPANVPTTFTSIQAVEICKRTTLSLRLDHGWKLHFAESTPDIQGYIRYRPSMFMDKHRSSCSPNKYGNWRVFFGY